MEYRGIRDKLAPLLAGQSARSINRCSGDAEELFLARSQPEITQPSVKHSAPDILMQNSHVGASEKRLRRLFGIVQANEMS